ncbi:MAG: hypothetical protein WAV28_09905, partial [Sedimentisphaerales bacterium]
NSSRPSSAVRYCRKASCGLPKVILWTAGYVFSQTKDIPVYAARHPAYDGRDLRKSAIPTPLDMKNTTLSNGVNRAPISCFARSNGGHLNPSLRSWRI